MKLIANITNREKLSGCKALWDYMGGWGCRYGMFTAVSKIDRFMTEFFPEEKLVVIKTSNAISKQ